MKRYTQTCHFYIIILIYVFLVRYTLKNSTSQSRIITAGDLALDGDISTCAISGRILTVRAWWRVKLDKEYSIDTVVVYYSVEELCGLN